MINSDCSLILRDLYSYDIRAAHPSILMAQHFDFNGTDTENKVERNIFIGKSQINNSNLSEFLNESVTSLMKFYFLENNISEDEIVTIQKDGCILKRMLDNNDEFIPLEYRGFIDFLIITPDRQKFLYCSDGKIIVKGVPHYYEALDSVYQMFANLNFYDKSILFEQMENIKNAILQSSNKKLFMIPRDEFSFAISTYTGNVEVKDADYISITQIDKNKYFAHFIKDFLNSIYLET